MLDLITGGLSILSGIFGMSAADDEASSARATAAAQKRAAWENANANIEVLRVQKESTISALNLSYDAAKTAYTLKQAAYGNEREANALAADAFLEQSRIDIQQLELQRDDELRQLDENVRAAKLEREYSFDAAKKAKTVAKEDARDFKVQAEGLVATSRAEQAASGFDMTGSPARVEEAVYADIEHGISKLLHKGDVEFWDEMRTIQEINRYIINQGVDKAATKYAADINMDNVEKRLGLELKAVAVQRKQTYLKEREALAEKQQAANEVALSKYTAKQSYVAQKGQQHAAARTAGYTATAEANSRVTSAKNAGTQALIGGISSGIDAIAKGPTFNSLAAKGGLFK